MKQLKISKSRLYDAFGEIIYAVAIADGDVSEKKLTTLKNALIGHPYAEQILWSFCYEKSKGNKLNDAYKRSIQTLLDNGPHMDYVFLFDTLQQIANTNNRMNKKEGRVICSLEKRLMAHYREHISFLPIN